MNWEIAPASTFGKNWEIWDKLNRKSLDTPLMDASTMQALLSHFGDGSEVIALKMSSTEAVAAGIFRRKNRFTWQTFQSKNIPFGSWICNSGAEIGTYASELCRILPGFNLVIGFSQLDPKFLKRPLDDKNVSTLDYIETPCIEGFGDFANYWQSRGKNLRHNIKRQNNRLARNEIETKLIILRHHKDMRAAVKAYGRMETAGWKGAADSAVAIENSQGRFYSRMFENLSKEGEAVILQFFFDDILVATDLCVLRKGTLIILKTTYDETIDGISPAHLMRYQTFQKMFDAGEVNTVEFYGPAMEWHRRWSDDVRTMYHLTYYRWPFLKRLRGGK